MGNETHVARARELDRPSPTAANLFDLGMRADGARGVVVVSAAVADLAARHWRTVVASVATFAWRCDAHACALGWPVLTLYGLRWHAPYANLAATGAAFVAA
jgi:hypothetical protein